MAQDVSNIHVNHDYLKFRGQRTGRLVAVEIVSPSEIDDSFTEYETAWSGGRKTEFKAPKLLILFFVGERKIPFSQVCVHTPERYHYYRGGLGKTFGFVAADDVEE